MATVPRSAVEADQKLEGAHDRAAEELAKHRWHWTLDESNARRVTIADYARAIGRSHSTVKHYASGYKLYQERMASGPAATSGFTIHDAIRLAGVKGEDQAFAEAIAEGSGQPVARVARGDNRHRMREIVGQAKDRAERRGTDPVDEARRIAQERVQSAAGERRRREQRASRHELRFVSIEGHLAVAKNRLTYALKEAEGVTFNEEELELLRHTIQQVAAVLELLDLRMGGAINVDWEAELAKLGNDE